MTGRNNRIWSGLSGRQYFQSNRRDAKQWHYVLDDEVQGIGMKNLWDNTHTVHHDYSYSPVIARFIANSTGEAISANLSVTVQKSLLDVADSVRDIVESLGVTSYLRSDHSDWIAVDGNHAGFLGVVAVDHRARYQPMLETEDEKEAELFEVGLQSFQITMVGNRTLLGKLVKALHKLYREQKYAKLKWWYDSNQGPTYRTMYMDNPNISLPTEFYPGLFDPKYPQRGSTPDEFIENYLKSPESILLMAGPPGTGKTTLLRHMIYKHDLAANVVYDEKLMENDTVFQSFLFDKENDVLIIEDADLIITSRQDDNNKLMARFLNVSDGLIKLPNKKLIFTTNISDFNRVDTALLRPGRCFADIHLRHLTLTEAQSAASVAGLTSPIEDKEYTLAELFNKKPQKQSKARAGFLAA